MRPWLVSGARWTAALLTVADDAACHRQPGVVQGCSRRHSSSTNR